MANARILSAESTVLSLINPWLKSDAERRLYSFNALSGYRTSQDMLRTPIPKMWAELQRRNESSQHGPRDQQQVLKIGRYALEGVALARVAFVYHKVSTGVDTLSAHDMSFRVIDAFAHAVRSGKPGLPSDQLLHEPLSTALQRYTGREGAASHHQHAYVGIAALGVRAIANAQISRKPTEMLLPAPGIPLDVRQEPWNVSEQLMKAPRLY